MDRIQAAQANAVQYKVPDHPNDSQPVTDANILDYKLSHAKGESNIRLIALQFIYAL